MAATGRAIAARIQAYLRAVARRQYEAVDVAPFTAYFHATDPLVHLNYAIPDGVAEGDVTGSLARLRSVFEARGRRPRFEHVASCDPALAAKLEGAGFELETRAQLMTCGPADLLAEPEVEGLVLEELDAGAPTDRLATLHVTQHLGFGMEAAHAGEDDVASLRRLLSAGRGFLASMKGEAVAGGILLSPIDGLAEVAGVATLEAFRRKGIGAAITARAARTAFAMGCDLAILSAGSERAGKVYERVGFRAVDHVLSHVG